MASNLTNQSRNVLSKKLLADDKVNFPSLNYHCQPVNCHSKKKFAL
jgi:hypothetical protein